MHNIKKLTDQFWVCAQITAEDIPAIRSKGFKGIICNRPDGEEAGQPAWQQIEAVARNAGLEAHFAPLAGPIPTKEALSGVAHAIEHVDGPILAYCRTGTRSEILWNALRSVARAAE